MQFNLVSKFSPTGDQPKAISQMVANLALGARHQVLLGVTGSGKTYTMAQVIAKTQRPTLVISPNKTLAAQLYQEFKEFFPHNAVHYFVSYYDYYQPEAYIPHTDTYIEKDAQINEVLDRFRHETAQALLSRRDVIVVASVSCIYNIGSPEEYQHTSLAIREGQSMTRRELLAHLNLLQYRRDDVDFVPGTFRVRGDTIEIFSVTGTHAIKIELEDDRIGRLTTASDPLVPSFEIIKEYRMYPAKFWVTPGEKLKIAMANIRLELEERLEELRKNGMLLEAQRLQTRTEYDLEMIEEAGYCHGIENYSRQMEFREAGTPPYTLIDYFPKDRLVFIDESHLTISQIRAMSVQDRIRKKSLIDHGFRLPSALDNRPLTFQEFEKKIDQRVYVSATPADFEKEKAAENARTLQKDPFVIEQLIRPTGLLEPVIEVRSARDQIKNVIEEIAAQKKKGHRVLLMTITKRLAEEIASYLQERGIETAWIHSEVKTLERPAILERLRRGEYDVLVGVNLLREGLDLPEVALVAILDADKEGFLRNDTTLIQIMGRAARHLEGKVILYADRVTGSMKSALTEIERRRDIQERYNKEYGIVPTPITKEIRPWMFGAKNKELAEEFSGITDVKVLEREMKQAAQLLDFERAARIRDMIEKVKGSPAPSLKAARKSGRPPRPSDAT